MCDVLIDPYRCVTENLVEVLVRGRLVLLTSRPDLSHGHCAYGHTSCIISSSHSARWSSSHTFTFIDMAPTTADFRLAPIPLLFILASHKIRIGIRIEFKHTLYSPVYPYPHHISISQHHHPFLMAFASLASAYHHVTSHASTPSLSIFYRLVNDIHAFSQHHNIDIMLALTNSPTHPPRHRFSP